MSFTGPPSIRSITTSDTSCLTSHAVVSWDPSSSDPVCGPVSYDVTVSPSDGVMITRITNTSYNLTGLMPGTNYTVIVAGSNMAGAGESGTVTFYIITMTEAVPTGESCT